jgi:hypothetical protein
MLLKFVSALMASLLFCTLLAISNYTPIPERQPDSYYWSFSSLMVVYLIYATPFFVIGGIPCSILIERFTRKLSLSSWPLLLLVSVLSYAMAGILLGGLFIVMDKNDLEIQPLLWVGAAPALIYYMVYLLLQLLFRRKIVA